MLALSPLSAALPMQDTEQMRVRPTTEAQAVAEFEATCVKGLYDLETLKRNAGASSRGYRYLEGSGEGWRNWISSYGSIHYLRTPDATGLAPRCNMTSFTRAKVDRGALEVALRAMAKRQAGRGYTELRENRGLAWSWFASADHPMTVEIVLDKKTPQQIILMLKPFAVKPD
ncbi:MAG: hypothetical protein ACAH11_05225 [Sphingomonas sp.]